MQHNNTIVWVDIPVTNLDRAISFYKAILGDSVCKISEHGFEFALLPHDNDNVSGCLCEIPNRKPSKDGALIYLNVEGRLHETIKIVRDLGQEIISEVEQIGPYGNRAVILDTEGNAIALYSKQSTKKDML